MAEFQLAESSAPMGGPEGLESAEAAPISAVLTEQEIVEPLKDSLASQTSKPAAGDESESAADQSEEDAEKSKDDNVATPSKSTAADKDGSTPVPALSSTAASYVDYANWEFEPPLANIRRLLKPILAKGTNISKDSVTALSRAAGIFVLYLSNCATDVAREGKRSTITGKDVIKALKELDMEEFIPQLEQFMTEHKKYEQTKKDEKEKDRIKKLHSESSGQVPGNKKGIRGADGKYANAPSGADKNDTDDEDDMQEEPLAFQIVDAISAKHGIEAEDGDDDSVKKRKLDHDEESNS